jgi:glycosyltransferase 2 family protein
MPKVFISKLLQYLLFLGLGLIFVWLSFRNMDAEKWQQLEESLKASRLTIGLPVLFMLVLSHWIRAIRWKLLLEPLGYRPSGLNAFFAVMVGYLVNLGVPRLGEIVKCTLLARYEKIPTDKLIGSIILERLIDALCLLGIFALTLAEQPELYTSIITTFFPAKQNALQEETTLPFFWITVGLLIFLLWGWMKWKKKTFQDLIQTGSGIIKRVFEGISSIRHLKKRKQFVALTLILWGLYLYSGYLGFLAFQETTSYGFKEALTILSAGSIGMIASPGGVGAYAYLVQKTMELYGLNYTISLAFGWLLWLGQTVVILVVGVLSFVALPWVNSKRK